MFEEENSKRASVLVIRPCRAVALAEADYSNFESVSDFGLRISASLGGDAATDLSHPQTPCVPYKPERRTR
jgi:hypothetical protein